MGGKDELVSEHTPENDWMNLTLFYLPDTSEADRVMGVNVQTDVQVKKLRPTDREMTTPFFMLQCVQIGLSIRDLDILTIDMVNDMYEERWKDKCSYAMLVTK